MASCNSSETRIKSEKGHQLYCKYWNEDKEVPISKIKALVFVVHGFAEHCLFYSELADFLIGHDYYVFSHDHVGHGQSEGDRAHIQDMDDYVNDMFTHIDKVMEKFPDKPIFLLGHSMGGTVAIQAARIRPDFFKGVVLIAPLLVPDKKNATPFKIFLGSLMAKVSPQMHIAKLDVKNISRDTEHVKKYEEDPLVYHRGIKCGFAMAVQKVLLQLRSDFENMSFPFLLLHGENDTICEIEGSKEMHQKAKSTDKQIKTFPDAFHQLHQELKPVKQATFEEIAVWLDNRV